MREKITGLYEKIGLLVDIRKGEYIKTISLFLYLLLVITCYVISKTVRDALFISKFGALKLPYVYIGIAVISSIFVAVYIKISKRMKEHILLSLTLLFFASNVILFWWLSRFHFEWLFPVIYIWAGVFGVIAPMQVWTLSNYTMTTREAKRLYGFIGSGGVLGAIVGGFFTSWMVPIIGTENLLLSIAVFMVICVFLVNLIWFKSAKKTAESNENEDVEESVAPSNLWESLFLISRSRYLILIASIISIASIATTIIDYQFKSIAESSLSSKDELAAFFGNFYGFAGTAAFILQITLTSKIMRKLGIGFTIFLLPVSLVLGSVTLLAYMTLWSAAILRGPDQLFKHSIDKSTIELLYLPVPLKIKSAVKSFIDTVIWRMADGAAGIILLVLTSIFAFSVREITIVNMVFLFVWIVVAYAARKGYVETLRTSISKKEMLDDIEDLSGESCLVSSPIASLQSSDTAEVLHGLEQVDFSKGRLDLVTHVEKLLGHESSEVRRKALTLLFATGDERLVGRIKNLLEDESIEVQKEALRFICTFGGGNYSSVIGTFLKSDSYRVRGAAICYIASQLNEDGFFLVAQKVLEKMLKNEDENARREAARVLGAIKEQSYLHNSIAELLRDPDIEVVREALLSAGETRKREFVPAIISKLEPQSTRAIAGEALLKYGSKILGTLRDYMLDEDVDIDIRRNIPQLISQIGTQESVDILTNSLNQQDPQLQLLIIKALNKMRSQSPDNPEVETEWQSQTSKINEQIINDVKEYYTAMTQFLAYNSEDGLLLNQQRRDLLQYYFKEKMEILLERIFRLLGLIYPPTDLYHAYHGLSSKDPMIKANALELLDNLLQSEHKNLVLPVIDEDMDRKYVLEASESLGIKACSGRLEVLDQLFESNEPLSILCAIDAVYNLQFESLYGQIDKAREHPEPMVSETAAKIWSLIQARKTRAPGQNVVQDLKKTRDLLKVNDLTALEKIKYLKKSILFANCRMDQLMEIAAIAHKVTFKKGEVIFHKNGPGDSLYCIVDGKVQLNKEGTAFKTVIGRRESFGTLAILDRKPRTFNAIAEVDVIAMKIGSDDFYNLLADRIKIVQRIFSRLTQEIRTHTGDGELGFKKRGRNRFQMIRPTERAVNE
jgi:ATP:ADP antiporter, AAA family